MNDRRIDTALWPARPPWIADADAVVVWNESAELVLACFFGYLTPLAPRALLLHALLLFYETDEEGGAPPAPTTPAPVPAPAPTQPSADARTLLRALTGSARLRFRGAPPDTVIALAPWARRVPLHLMRALVPAGAVPLPSAAHDSVAAAYAANTSVGALGKALERWLWDDSLPLPEAALAPLFNTLVALDLVELVGAATAGSYPAVRLLSRGNVASAEHLFGLWGSIYAEMRRRARDPGLVDGTAAEELDLLPLSAWALWPAVQTIAQVPELVAQRGFADDASMHRWLADQSAAALTEMAAARELAPEVLLLGLRVGVWVQRTTAIATGAETDIPLAKLRELRANATARVAATARPLLEPPLIRHRHWTAEEIEALGNEYLEVKEKALRARLSGKRAALQKFADRARDDDRPTVLHTMLRHPGRNLMSLNRKLVVLRRKTGLIEKVRDMIQRVLLECQQDAGAAADAAAADDGGGGGNQSISDEESEDDESTSFTSGKLSRLVAPLPPRSQMVVPLLQSRLLDIDGYIMRLTQTERRVVDGAIHFLLCSLRNHEVFKLAPDLLTELMPMRSSEVLATAQMILNAEVAYTHQRTLVPWLYPEGLWSIVKSANKRARALEPPGSSTPEAAVPSSVLSAIPREDGAELDVAELDLQSLPQVARLVEMAAGGSIRLEATDTTRTTESRNGLSLKELRLGVKVRIVSGRALDDDLRSAAAPLPKVVVLPANPQGVASAAARSEVLRQHRAVAEQVIARAQVGGEGGVPYEAVDAHVRALLPFCDAVKTLDALFSEGLLVRVSGSFRDTGCDVVVVAHPFLLHWTVPQDASLPRRPPHSRKLILDDQCDVDMRCLQPPAVSIRNQLRSPQVLSALWTGMNGELDDELYYELDRHVSRILRTSPGLTVRQIARRLSQQGLESHVQTILDDRVRTGRGVVCYETTAYSGIERHLRLGGSIISESASLMQLCKFLIPCFHFISLFFF